MVRYKVLQQVTNAGYMDKPVTLVYSRSKNNKKMEQLKHFWKTISPIMTIFF